MVPIQVALVPYEVDVPDLLPVVAALQIQLTRDFTPIWGVPAVVSAYRSLDELPPTCIPLLIVPQGTLLARMHAFHITEKGQPIGLLEKRQGWSLDASHELLEIVLDPLGERKVPGDSIADSHQSDVVPSDHPYTPQGPVEYLLEVCDPCQDVCYTVNGFQVSDFITPLYYAPVETVNQRYSFTGEISRPLEVLPGGYISWYTSDPGTPVWQATNRAGTLEVGPLPVATPRFSRDWVDYLKDAFDSVEPESRCRERTIDTEKSAEDSAARFGAELRADVDKVLQDIYRTNRATPEVALDGLLNQLDRLVNEPGYYETFRDDPATRATDLKNSIGTDVEYPGGKVPTQEQFSEVLDALKQFKSRNAGLERPGFSGTVATIAMEGKT